MRWLTLALCLLLAGCGSRSSALAIGSSAPRFSLPGTDQATHALDDYARSPVLAVVFTCNRCPETQRYEARLQKLYDDYRAKGLALVAINPDQAGAVKFDDLRYTDVGESLAEMKARAELRRLTYPYLSAGGSTLAAEFGVTAMPHMFVFDRDRKLQYEGRIDDDPTGAKVTSEDARTAIDAILAGKAVPVATTRVTGCRLAGPDATVRDKEIAAFAAEPVNVEAAGPETMKALRKNGTGKLLLVNFWATWCAPCIGEFPELEDTYRMYRGRGLDFVSVSANDPEERPQVVEFLKTQRASHRNLQFATPDVYGLQAAFDPAMPAPVPFTLLLAPNGDVLFQELGALDAPKLRRAILANLPADQASAGQRDYWAQP
jgi:thiol-disulfide isomerase/thioredoxin